MNTDLTELAFILDRSGSMSSLASSAIEGFNHFLHEQQNAPGLARLTVVLFDDEYLVPAQSLPIVEVLPLDATSYVPRNNTALLDAIGRTIDELGARLHQTPEADRPGKVIIAILTDGLENASEHYTWGDVAKRIKHQTQTYQWEFLFLAANQDAIATAGQLHIAAENAATYQADGVGQVAGSASLSKKTAAIRRRVAGKASAADLIVACAPMAAILQEEDNKRREQ